MNTDVRTSTFRVYLDAGVSFAFEIDQMEGKSTPEERLTSALGFLGDVKKGVAAFDTRERPWILTPDTRIVALTEEATECTTHSS